MSFSIVDYIANDLSNDVILTDDDKKRIYSDTTRIINILKFMIKRLNGIRIKSMTDDIRIKDLRIEGISSELKEAVGYFCESILKTKDNVTISKDQTDQSDNQSCQEIDRHIVVNSPVDMDTILIIINMFLNGNLL